jgi:hypothetical protein
VLFQEPVVVQGSDMLFQKKKTVVYGSDVLAKEPIVHGSVLPVSRTTFYLCLYYCSVRSYGSAVSIVTTRFTTVIRL